MVCSVVLNFLDWVGLGGVWVVWIGGTPPASEVIGGHFFCALGVIGYLVYHTEMLEDFAFPHFLSIAEIGHAVRGRGISLYEYVMGKMIGYLSICLVLGRGGCP